MKQFRFGLCSRMDARLIAKIEQKSNGGSMNDALRQMIRFWEEAEERQIMTLERQPVGSISTGNDTELEINLDGLDSVFSDTGE